jgi:hypothetical protein
MNVYEYFADFSGDGDSGDEGGDSFRHLADDVQLADRRAKADFSTDNFRNAIWSDTGLMLICIDPTNLLARAVNVVVRARQA